MNKHTTDGSVVSYYVALLHANIYRRRHPQGKEESVVNNNTSKV